MGGIGILSGINISNTLQLRSSMNLTGMLQSTTACWIQLGDHYLQHLAIAFINQSDSDVAKSYGLLESSSGFDSPCPNFGVCHLFFPSGHLGHPQPNAYLAESN
jgi:hypothetical protein